MEFSYRRTSVCINYIANSLKPLRRNAVTLAHRIHGKSPVNKGEPPIIVLHGLLGSKKNWESMSKRLAEVTNVSVVAADLRNHGESPHTKSHTYPELASDVSQLLSTLAIRKASVIGHSMGGRTAMVLALTEPDKVASLVVVDISPVSTAGILSDFFPKLIDTMTSVNFKGIKDVNKARSVVKDKIMESGLVKSPDSLHFVLMNVGLRPDRTIGWLNNPPVLKQYFKTIASFPSEVLSKKYVGPTLFVGGEDSPYLPKSDLPGIKKLFPRVQLEYVPGVGHNVHAEDPAGFLRIVKQFLKK